MLLEVHTTFSLPMTFSDVHGIRLVSCDVYVFRMMLEREQQTERTRDP